jgi:hypothetical protein
MGFFLGHGPIKDDTSRKNSFKIYLGCTPQLINSNHTKLKMPRWGHCQNVGLDLYWFVLSPFILGMPPPCGFILYINTSCWQFETKKNSTNSINIFFYSTHSTIKICKLFFNMGKPPLRKVSFTYIAHQRRNLEISQTNINF